MKEDLSKQKTTTITEHDRQSLAAESSMHESEVVIDDNGIKINSEIIQGL